MSDTGPTHTYTYFDGNKTDLVASDAVMLTEGTPTPPATLNFTTAYGRNNLGLVTSTTLSGDSAASDDQYLGSYINYSASSFDGNLDLPTGTADAYGHATTTAYNDYLGSPTNVTGPNAGDTTTTQYDALGRVVQVVEDLTGITTTTSYAWDSSQAVSPPSGSSGLAETSVYRVTTLATAKPPITAYFDRLGREVRASKQGFAGQVIFTDTVYDTLGRVAATSLPYLRGSGSYWPQEPFDNLGRISTVTAPNGTVTTNTYLGRATQASVQAGAANETTLTLVDGAGKTVKVWNAKQLGGSHRSG